MIWSRVYYRGGPPLKVASCNLQSPAACFGFGVAMLAKAWSMLLSYLKQLPKGTGDTWSILVHDLLPSLI
jgi:hypothetical protein